MIITFHTPDGTVDIDTDTVTDGQLKALGLTRSSIADLMPRDALSELDALKRTIADHETRLGKDIDGHIR